MTTKLEHALSLAEQGFYVFRLRKNGKVPLAKGWQDEATRDPDEIRELFLNRDYNIGIFTGRYDRDTPDNEALVVVDVDTKPGKEGNTTMRGFDAIGLDFPDTLTVTTASGGRHLIYWHDYAVQGGANKVGLHVDLKSHGGYIVAAGSTIDGIAYQPANNLEPEQAPDWLIERVGRPIDRSALTEATDALDTLQSIQRATAYLKDVAEPAISGAGGNDRTFKTTLSVRDFGISEPQALELLWDHYNPKCSPGWEIDELEKIVGNAYRYAAKPAGNESPHRAGTFDAIPEEQPEAPKQSGDPFEWADTVEPAEGLKPLLENMLDQQAMSILYGESNTGKTFVAMDIAWHIANGEPWHNNRVQQGSVLYLAAEGGKGARARVKALKLKYGQTIDIPFALVPQAFNLFDSADHLKRVVQLIKRAEERGPVKLVVIDTLSRVLAGGNENSSEDMTLFIENIDTIRKVTRAHVMIVHHSGKDTSKGARGHSSLRAATDTELEIADNAILVRKQRDMEFSKPLGFELETVVVGQNAYNEDITSCTINLIDYEARETFNAKNRIEPRDSMALLALKECTSGRKLRDFDNVVDQKVWAKCCKVFDYTLVPGAVAFPESDSSFNKAFQRARDRLVGFGRVEEVEPKQWAIIKERQPVV